MDGSTSHSTMDSSSTAKRSKGKAATRQCRICDGPAQYFYFGIISCYSCKMFFRRNAASKKNSLQCQFAGQCGIKVSARYKCSACRLAKCFACGMSTDRFRPPRLNRVKPNAKTNELKEKPSQHSPKSNPLPLLTANQWTLLFQLYDAYNESELVSIGQRLRDTHNDLQQSFVVYEALVEEFFAMIYETTGRYLRANGDLCSLPFDERSSLLRNATENVACMIGVLGAAHRRLYDLDDFSHIMKMKYGEHIMKMKYGEHIMKMKYGEHIMKMKYGEHIMKMKYGEHIMKMKYGEHMVDIHRSATKYVDPDIVISKVAISLFAVSESTCMFQSNVFTNSIDPRLTVDLQNKYVEVLWKYLLCKYNDHGAVRRFVNMIVWLITLKSLTHHARSSAAHTNDIESLLEQTELTLLLNDVEQLF